MRCLPWAIARAAFAADLRYPGMPAPAAARTGSHADVVSFLASVTNLAATALAHVSHRRTGRTGGFNPEIDPGRHHRRTGP